MSVWIGVYRNTLLLTLDYGVLLFLKSQSCVISETLILNFGFVVDSESDYCDYCAREKFLIFEIIC